MWDGRWAAPGRVNLIGEHLDYNGGPVLPIAIDRRSTVAARRRDDAVVHVGSDLVKEPSHFAVTAQPGEVTGWAAYVAGVVWALRSDGHQVPGLDLAISSDVPLGAGLSSSAALECAVAVAIRDLAGLDVGDVALALLCQRAENTFAGVPSGNMDQLAAICGRRGHALLIDTARPAVRPVPASWEADGLRLVVIDTRARHTLADGGYAQRRRECEEAAWLLDVPELATADAAALERLADPTLRRRARHVVTETARVQQAVDAMAGRDWARLGRLFVQSHESMRDDFEISCAELDTAVETATASGALGARMTGGGFGGSAIALVPAPSVDAVATACRDAFDARGFATPACFTVAPSAGATRLES